MENNTNLQTTKEINQEENLDQPNNKTCTKKTKSSHVRFNKTEYNKINLDSIVSGKSIPELLKNTYFSNPYPEPLFDFESKQTLMKELKRIGVNINQIAKNINSGISKSWNESFENLEATFNKLLSFVRKNNGCNQN